MLLRCLGSLLIGAARDTMSCLPRADWAMAFECACDRSVEPRMRTVAGGYGRPACLLVSYGASTPQIKNSASSGVLCVLGSYSRICRFLQCSLAWRSRCERRRPYRAYTEQHRTPLGEARALQRRGRKRAADRAYAIAATRLRSAPGGRHHQCFARRPTRAPLLKGTTGWAAGKWPKHRNPKK